MMDRRKFLGVTGAAFVAAPGAPLILKRGAPAIDLPKLPYDRNGLAPVITGTTIDFHYGKHHAGYVRKVNAAIKGTKLEGQSLEAIIRATAGDPKMGKAFNSAAQTWNHTFYWNSMKPKGGGQPDGALARKINASFGDLDGFKKAFVKCATGRFGSGWAWLVEDGDKLSCLSTANAHLPMTQGKKALLTVDVWEHAYYLDYQNARKSYVEAVLDKLINWDFAARNLG